jgi:hypothetical protein
VFDISNDEKYSVPKTEEGERLEVNRAMLEVDHV